MNTYRRPGKWYVLNCLMVSDDKISYVKRKVLPSAPIFRCRHAVECRQTFLLITETRIKNAFCNTLSSLDPSVCNNSTYYTKNP